MSEFEFRQTPEQHIVALRMTRPMTEIGQAMGEAFPRLYEAVVGSGVQPAGMPLARYLDMADGAATFECAIPVPEPFAGTGEMYASTVGGGEVAFTVHVGPYVELGKTWEALSEWVAQQGRTPAGPMWECYLNDPGEVGEAELRTELYVPVS